MEADIPYSAPDVVTYSLARLTSTRSIPTVTSTCEEIVRRHAPQKPLPSIHPLSDRAHRSSFATQHHATSPPHGHHTLAPHHAFHLPGQFRSQPPLCSTTGRPPPAHSFPHRPLRLPPVRACVRIQVRHCCNITFRFPPSPVSRDIVLNDMAWHGKEAEGVYPSLLTRPSSRGRRKEDLVVRASVE